MATFIDFPVPDGAELVCVATGYLNTKDKEVFLDLLKTSDNPLVTIDGRTIRINAPCRMMFHGIVNYFKNSGTCSNAIIYADILHYIDGEPHRTDTGAIRITGADQTGYAKDTGLYVCKGHNEADFLSAGDIIYPVAYLEKTDNALVTNFIYVSNFKYI